MKLQKMKDELEELIEEIIQEKKDCGNNTEANNKVMNSYDSLVKDYRVIAYYLSNYAETDAELDIIKTMETLSYVRCFGIRPADAKKEIDEFMENDDSGGLW